METVGQNEAEIPPKRIKFEEIMEKEVDRICTLPDCLLLEILSRLPSTEDAIKTGALSKRWEHVWTSVPVLIFTDLYYIIPWDDLVAIVDKTLSQCRQLKLKKFLLCRRYERYEDRFESQVNNWIRYAINRDVEELDISFKDCYEFVLHQFIFTSSCFTDVRLSGCVINPTGPVSWNILRSLRLTRTSLDEDVIQNILSGSPLLETLELYRCYGCTRLNITSKSLKKLVFSRYSYRLRCSARFYIIEINAPNILSLTVEGCTGSQKLLLVNVSSLVEANLDYACETHVNRKNVKEVEKMLKGLIQNLSHVKELKIGDSFSEALAGLKARGFVFPSNLRIPAGYKRVGGW